MYTIIGDADFRCFWVALSCFATSSVFAKKLKNLKNLINLKKTKKPKNPKKNFLNLGFLQPWFGGMLNLARSINQSIYRDVFLEPFYARVAHSNFFRVLSQLEYTRISFNK